MKSIKKIFTLLILFTLITATGYGHSGAQLSADGQFNPLIKPYNETNDIWVKCAARLLTDDTNRPITGFFWRWDDQDKAGDNAASVSAPKPAVDLRPSKSNYQVKIEVGGQAIPFTLTTEIREEGGAWKVIDQATIPIVGEMIDMTVLERGSLVLTKRIVRQGSVAIEMAIKGNKASGSMAMGGPAKPIDVETGGAVFADGAGQYDVLASLPLAEGYSVTFRNLNLQKQKIELKQLKVTGIEKVTVPAGNFDAFKCEITPAQGKGGKTTLWVATDDRKVIKVSALVPQMNGAILTSELTQ